MNYKVIRVVFVCIVTLGLTTSFVDGVLIPDLSFDHYPRVRAIDVSVTYDANGGTGGTGLLTASGYTWELYMENASNYDDLDGDFYLEVEINKTTLKPASGFLTVDDYYMSGDDLFYSTIITDFGFGGDDMLQFRFVQEGTGMMAPDNEPVGVIISAVSIPNELFSEANQPTFLVNFSNSGNGYSNIFYLPEPATMLLLAAGLGSICIRRRRKK